MSTEMSRMKAAHERVKGTQAALSAATKAEAAARTILANVENELAKLFGATRRRRLSAVRNWPQR
jgi:hypothetical protein